MSWKWKEEYLDRLLVPFGLLIIITYHVFLFNRYRKSPLTTVVGSEDYYKKIWAEKTLQLDAKDRGTSVNVISSNISAANTLSSVSLVMSSLIGAWIGSSNDKNIFVSSIIYGDSSSTIISIKYVALLSCFLISFAAFIQTTRHYALAAFLISLPSCDIPVNYVQKPILKYVW
ncbi:Cobyrinate a,c-diamide synthase [Heracleum sosnowskyi]|uniref:Cobyrinate a,c-diamide synthase n=1 Tax=Heracleum sosnowskyi TaxID=360622 RepID=A0AAD8INQ5_9APIA|nr:Cobyrinate a,c-diamide synthase [Heracleum sosnowskyi]